MSGIKDLFSDQKLVEKIQAKLPKLFQIAEIEMSRKGKVGMEVGTPRERIISSLLIYKFGEENVDVEIAITESESDVKVFNEPISVKTFTNKYISPVKLFWGADEQSGVNFLNRYTPSCDMIYVHVNWGGAGAFYYIPKEVQIDVFNKMGRENYILLPKAGTNSRGVSLRANAAKNLVADSRTLRIPIVWNRQDIDYNPYERWLELWQED